MGAEETSMPAAGGSSIRLAVVAIALLAALSFLTFQRATVFASEEDLMRDSLAKNPADWYARNELGTLLARRNDLPGALDQFQAAFQLQPDDAKVNSNLGHALALTGKPGEAEARYRASLAEDPMSDDTHKNFADLLRREGRVREAILQYEAGLAIKPDSSARLNLAQLYFQAGGVDQARREFQEVLRRDPDNVGALNNLAWLLATCSDGHQRDGREAVRLAEKACALTQFKQAPLTGTLAAAYAEAGRFTEAAETGRKTIQLAGESGDGRTAAIARQLLDLYLSNRPYHQPAASADSAR
jgi:Flp pilus assembly protein TadD